MVRVDRPAAGEQDQSHRTGFDVLGRGKSVALDLKQPKAVAEVLD